jgi:hypothetical protein
MVAAAEADVALVTLADLPPWANTPQATKPRRAMSPVRRFVEDMAEESWNPGRSLGSEFLDHPFPMTLGLE